MTALPEEAYAVALLALPGMIAGHLRAVLDGAPPSRVWEWLRARTKRGTPPTLPAGAAVDRWRANAAAGAPEELWRRLRLQRVEVALRGAPHYPWRLAEDPYGPALVFYRGDPAVLDGPTVAVVGTRRCTGYGSEVATALGRDLARAGVVVVSGLALGIDGAAQRGALASATAPVAGVAASGIDVVYPAAHAQLWADVAGSGVLLSDAPPGASPNRLRFGPRNQVMASLSDVVVVVESHRRGGSLSTVDAANSRGRAIMAVPGPVTSPASAGTNALLAEGLPPARDADDVLALLGLVSATRPRRRRSRAAMARAAAAPAPRPPRPGAGPPPRPTTPPAASPAPDGAAPLQPDAMAEPVLPAVDRRVLDAVDVVPTPLETVLARTDLSPGAAALALERLVEAGLLRSGAGWWEHPHRLQRPRHQRPRAVPDGGARPGGAT